MKGLRNLCVPHGQEMSIQSRPTRPQRGSHHSAASRWWASMQWRTSSHHQTQVRGLLECVQQITKYGKGIIFSMYSCFFNWLQKDLIQRFSEFTNLQTNMHNILLRARQNGKCYLLKEIMQQSVITVHSFGKSGCSSFNMLYACHFHYFLLNWKFLYVSNTLFSYFFQGLTNRCI